MNVSCRLSPPARLLDDRELEIGLHAARTLGRCGNRVVTEREAARIILAETHVLELLRRLELLERIYETLMRETESLSEFGGVEQIVYLMAAIADVDDRHAFVDWSEEIRSPRVDSVRAWFERHFRSTDPVWDFIRR